MKEHRHITQVSEETPELLLKHGGLKEGVSETVSVESGVPAASVFGVGSFYHLLDDTSVKLRVCQGLTCRMRGSRALLDEALEAGLPASGCSCLAACDKPVAVLKERTVLPSLSAGSLSASSWEDVASDEMGQDGWMGYVWPEQTDEDALVWNLSADHDYSCSALTKAKTMKPEEIVKELVASGLQGRGGAGFPAGRKWESLLSQPEKHRYVVLNADEAEPGTFKDREVLLRRPDLVLEGLAIAAHTIGASDVYLYLRGAFSIPKAKVKEALKTFEDQKSFAGIRFHFHDGHGAYICGEETALLESLEGKRGMPRLKPPFPTEAGLWGKPTLIHNVETIAAIPRILLKGGEWFKKLGKTEAGMKLISLSGDVNKPGIYEVPLGTSLDELVEHAGGYAGKLYAFSPGGASTGFLPASESSRPMDWASLREVGSSIGSAGCVVLNSDNDLKQAVRDQLKFFEVESCGQCAPCRIGTRYQRESVERGQCQHSEDVAWEMAEGSICGLGQAASTPLSTAQKYFPEAFES